MNVLSPQPVLTPEQLAYYRQHEYLILRSIVPNSLLDGAQVAIERWVDSEIRNWIGQGKLSRDFREFPFNTRLMHAWYEAGKPLFNPNPTLEIVGSEMYEILRYPVFIEIAKQLFESPNITASGVFHCRPDLPGQPLTDTPWHQDGQCCPSLAGSKFVVMWFPLMDVDEHSACLQGAIGRQHQGRLYKNYKDPHGYYISMRPEDVSRLTQIETFRMKRGDLLFFNEMLPHRAIPNHSQGIRWSIDFRYYESSCEAAMSPSRSFVCANEQPGKIDTSYAEWERRMHLPIS